MTPYSICITVFASVAFAACGSNDVPSPSTGGSAGQSGGAGDAGAAASGGSAGAGGGELLPALNDVTVDEEVEIVIPLGPAATVERVWVTGLPAGAHFDEVTREIRFRPDFIQGRAEPWTVTVLAKSARAEQTRSFSLFVTDSIQPPEPVVVSTAEVGDCTRYTLSQTTDDFLDSPGHAGRSFEARVTVPDTAALTPVRITLHGYGASSPSSPACGSEIVIHPHDPHNTYWWGYSENLPDGDAVHGRVPPYTVRRVLQLLSWVYREHQGDPERTSITGSSMGGAGALAIGLLWGRHFAAIDARYGQAIPWNHRPGRLATLEPLWGARELGLEDGAGMSVWQRMDLTRALRDDPEAAAPFVFMKHGKDDATIHFGAVVIESPLTGRTFYEALETHPHYVVWDEGGHGTPDPVMPSGWWDGGWNRMLDETSFTRRDRATPAFSSSSLDGDPGDATGNGAQPWSNSSGFAGSVSVPGDTGWGGDLAGAKNRHLRWDATQIVDARDRFEIRLWVHDGAGDDPPEPGYPTLDDRVGGALPASVSVTIRGAKHFGVRPDTNVTWQFGPHDGTATADEHGVLTIPLELDTAPRTLVLTQ